MKNLQLHSSSFCLQGAHSQTPASNLKASSYSCLKFIFSEILVSLFQKDSDRFQMSADQRILNLTSLFIETLLHLLRFVSIFSPNETCISENCIFSTGRDTDPLCSYLSLVSGRKVKDWLPEIAWCFSERLHWLLTSFTSRTGNVSTSNSAETGERWGWNQQRLHGESLPVALMRAAGARC